jgi:hypothetical protein
MPAVSASARVAILSPKIVANMAAVCSADRVGGTGTPWRHAEDRCGRRPHPSLRLINFANRRS